MKTRFLQAFGAITLGILGCGNAAAVLIQDNYWGADGFTSLSDRDRIGDSRYEVYSMDVTFGGGYMNVRVNTNFSTPDPYKVNFGDLFISTNGWNPKTTATNYRDDNIFTGEKWEFVFDTSAEALYGDNFNIRTSDYFFGGSGYYYRKNQEVQYGGGGTDMMDSSSVNLSKAGNNGFIEYNILLSSLGLASDTDIGLKWGMTCANDTIEGVVHYTSVPEPSTVLLFGIGMLGMGFATRKTLS